ncbi:E3 ubiquitin-protein ligase At3g02290-like [Triticum urartu]|uniref:RING-type E3 ubiquitin transferase n=1 Tax=Triticum urartu TaxID=4572 RepID=A0A8R7PC02_TRIUA|nr:E3 ubiquitin-protein ligase At3g02290-like [Triticum urartu]
MGSILCCLRGPDDDDEAPGCCACLPWPARAYTRVAPVPPEASTGSGQEDPLNTFRPPPRPLPYDDPRFRHPTEKSILLGERSNADTGSTDDGDEKADGPSSLEAPPGGGKPGGTQVCVDCDEDDCPICLEEYDYENPKILLQCNHDFHLGCIYAWMERSQSCPVCAVVMMFKEDQ